jgi:hypothetical protein
MGDLMKEDDIFIESLFDLLNLRFAPTPTGRGAAEWLGGIEEVAVLQRQFQIFQQGRSFKDSVALLNAGGFWNWRAKKRWYDLLSILDRTPSNQAGQNGNEAIVNALIANLAPAAAILLPVYFKGHPASEDGRVLIRDGDRPLFYLEQNYLTVSIPLRPRRRGRARPRQGGARRG